MSIIMSVSISERHMSHWPVRPVECYLVRPREDRAGPHPHLVTLGRFYGQIQIPKKRQQTHGEHFEPRKRRHTRHTKDDERPVQSQSSVSDQTFGYDLVSGSWFLVL
jgi:hypothetical protein